MRNNGVTARIKIITVGVMILLILTMSACKKEVQENVMKDGTPVEAQTVVLGDISASYRVPGTVVSAETEQLVIPLTARCLNVYVEEGEVVKQGKALFRLDVSSVMDNLAVAQINYENAVQSYEDQSSLLDEQLKQQEDTYQNQLKLLQIGAVSQLEVDGAKIALDNAKASRTWALNQLEIAIKNAESGKKQVEDTLKGVEADGTVRAPIAGTVASLSVYEDAYTSPGAPLAEVASNKDLEVSLAVSEQVVSKIHAGDKAKVDVLAVSETFTADVVDVSQVPSRTSKLYPVTVSLPHNAGNTLSGMFADVVLYTDRKESVVVVPSEAVLVHSEGQYVVVLDEENIARLAPVEIGLIGDGISEIVEGLIGGELVVTVGQSYLKDGDLARIVSTEE